MSAFRLAKFNLDQRQSFGFRGLPTPANALVIVFLPLATNSEQFPFWSNLFSEPWVLTFVTLLLSWLLISDLPLMAMKFKSFSWQDNKVKYLFILFMICSVMFLRFWAAPFLLLIYITLSQFEKKENPES
jgi:CDP-diacylglycerol--serine O-phosphatidyltransferase